MWIVVTVFGVIGVLFGVVGLVDPERTKSIARTFQTPPGLYVAAALRLVLGSALLVVGPTSKAPDLFLILGVGSILVGLLMVSLGLGGFRKSGGWWSALNHASLRALSALAVGGGLLIVYTAAP